MDCGSSVETIKGIFSIYKKHTLSHGTLVDSSHGMDGSFTASHLSCTSLEGASCRFNVRG